MIHIWIWHYEFIVYEFIYETFDEFIAYEFIVSYSYMNSKFSWIQSFHEFIYEYYTMNSYAMNSYMNMTLWIHVFWIHAYEFRAFSEFIYMNSDNMNS